MDDDKSDSNSSAGFRERIARTVLVLSAASTMLVAVVVISVTAIISKHEAAESSRLVFNTVVPLFATWVGTVLAYYFSRSNFEAANKSVRQLVDRLTPEQVLNQTFVRAAMIPLEDIRKIVVPEGELPENVAISEIRSLIDPETSEYTRAPIMSHDARTLYVIHQSTLFEFLAKRSGGAPALKPGEILAIDRYKTAISAWIAVPADATLGSAKRALDASAPAQDAFVTRKGGRGEPALGWLTNVDIAQAIRDVR